MDGEEDCLNLDLPDLLDFLYHFPQAEKMVYSVQKSIQCFVELYFLIFAPWRFWILTFSRI